MNRDIDEFKYEVEYSTFDDKLFKLDDLTVRNYVKLAYRMAKKEKGKGNALSAVTEDEEEEIDDSEDDSYDAYEEDEDSTDEDEDDELEETGKGGDKKKKKKGKKKKNKVWLHFLRHAFVRTASDKELKKL